MKGRPPALDNSCYAQFTPRWLYSILSAMELAVYLVFLVFLVAFVGTFGRAFFRGAPYAPSDPRAIATMLGLAKPAQQDVACDIGSGDGRIMITLANYCERVDGYEINPFLVLWTRMRLRRRNLSGRVKVFRGSLWKADFTKYTVITLFGIPYIMKELEKKLLQELPKGARVVSNRFTFPNWKPVVKKDRVYLYVKE